MKNILIWLKLIKNVPLVFALNLEKLKKIEDLQLYDHLQNKIWAIKLASDAAITVLRVD